LKNKKVEIGVQMPTSVQNEIDNYLLNSSFKYMSNGLACNNCINPFNPDVQGSLDAIDVHCTFTDENNNSILVNGFYFIDIQTQSNSYQISPNNLFPFRIRFAPPSSGYWTFSIEIITSRIAIGNLSGSFVVENSNSNGLLKVNNEIESPFNGNKFLKFENGKNFIPIGENICWANLRSRLNDSQLELSTLFDYVNNKQKKYINELADFGGNSFRLWLSNISLGIEHNILNDYSFFCYEQYEIDNIINLAENRNLYVQICLDIADRWVFNNENLFLGQFTRWEGNPYRSANNNKLLNINYPIDFFQSNNAKEFYKRKLRYIVARWGYSNNILGWELINEPWHLETDIVQTGNPPILNGVLLNEYTSWMIEMAEYIKVSLNDKHLIFYNDDYDFNRLNNILNPPVNRDYFDVISVHHYNLTREVNSLGMGGDIMFQMFYDNGHQNLFI
jgi:hypothetical protein